MAKIEVSPGWAGWLIRYPQFFDSRMDGLMHLKRSGSEFHDTTASRPRIFLLAFSFQLVALLLSHNSSLSTTPGLRLEEGGAQQYRWGLGTYVPSARGRSTVKTSQGNAIDKRSGFVGLSV